jgi:hypothetical protein
MARPAEDWTLLPFERTLLHLYRRCGIRVDELASALSVERMRLELELGRLERRVLDTIALRLLVHERQGCEALDLTPELGLVDMFELVWGHAGTCPECSARVAERAAATDMLGHPAAEVVIVGAPPRPFDAEPF